MTTARLYALARLSAEWHGGQFTRAYRIGCRARALLRRRGISLATPYWDAPARWAPSFRRDVARNLRAFRRAFKVG